MTLDRGLLGQVRRLDQYDLRRLMIFAAGLLAARGDEVETASGLQPGTDSKPSYRRQWVRCGKKGCTRCPHGPYWYAYWRQGGRLRSRYVGKELPDEVPADP